jgi:CheY-like chemotaxis protein
MKIRAIVVDDNAENLLLEKDLLEVAGFEVFEAMNAANGMILARKVKPDVIVMDVRLPDMAGTEAIRLLRQDKETYNIPVVFVTASVMKMGKVVISKIPNSILISKPLNTRTFAKEIKQFIIDSSYQRGINSEGNGK